MIVDVGTVLGGRYRLTRAVASGGMGTVYEAFQEDLGRRVAIKVLRAHLAQPEDIARLEREARAAASLGHPHIGQVFDFVPGNPPFVVMELLEGATLGQLLRQERVQAGPRAARLVSQVLAALDAAHRAGIVHRDIKPSNVFIVQMPTLGEVVKVLDFGVAKLLQHAPSLTAHGDTVGTLPYMSPEQFSAGPVDGRSDVFSVGLVLYEMLAGHRAYDERDPGNLTRRVMHGEVPPLAQRAPWVDPALAAIVTRAIAYEPPQRFASAAEMAEALAAWSSSARAPTADGSSAHRDLAPLPSAAAPTLTTGIQPHRWGAGRSLALGGLAVVAFAVGLGVMELGGARGPLPAPSQRESGALPSASSTSAITAGPGSLPTVRLGASCRDAPEDLGRGVGMGCSAPSMVWMCLSHFESCGAVDQCFDTRRDRAHCGACGHACAPDRDCRQGACVAASVAPQRSDAGAKIDAEAITEPAEAPGRPCSVPNKGYRNLVCRAATMTWGCAVGDLVCSGVCASSKGRDNCGACGHRCQADEICNPGSGHPTCVACPPSTTRCDNRCVLLGTDADCGACGDRCAAPAHCVLGRCQPG